MLGHDSMNQDALLPRKLLPNERRSDSDTVGRLCKRCTQIDIKQLFHGQACSNKKEARQVIELDAHGRDGFDSSCDMCSLFKAVQIREKDLPQNALLHCLYPDFGTAIGKEQKGSVLAVADSRASIESSENASFISLTTVSVSALYSQALPARRIHQDRIDFAVCQGWLNDCEQQHEDCIEYIRWSPWPSNLMVIDCAKRQLVEAHTDCKYAALSYVWGSTIADCSDAPEKTDRTDLRILPQTVEDALTVTQGLGLRYLWVDRYCIDQSDQAVVSEQIDQMDIIYRCAKVTIVDAAGCDANSGLPGVSRLSIERFEQPHANVGEHCFVSIGSPPYEAVQRSAWKTRAWTFQEDFFSCRRLYFTRQQVFFRCRLAEYRETIDFSSRHCPTAGEFLPELRLFPNQQVQGAVARLPPILFSYDPLSIFRLLEEYSGRILTYKHDVIRAFKGVFSAFENGPHPVYEHFGIPIVSAKPGPHGFFSGRRASRSFAFGLCWIAERPAERRYGFPSWSWAGWNLVLPRDSYNGRFNSLAVGFHDDTIVESVDGSMLSNNQDILAFKEHAMHAQPPSQSIFLTAWTVSFEIESVPDLTGSRQDTYPIQPLNCYAVFKSESTAMHVAMFLLDPKRPRLSSNINGGEVMGVVLPQGFQGEAADRRMGANSFIILVEDQGGYYERIGHLDFDDVFLRERLTGNLLDSGSLIHHAVSRNGAARSTIHPYSLVFNSKRRRRLEIR